MWFKVIFGIKQCITEKEVRVVKAKLGAIATSWNAFDLHRKGNGQFLSRSGRKRLDANCKELETLFKIALDRAIESGFKPATAEERTIEYYRKHHRHISKGLDSESIKKDKRRYERVISACRQVQQAQRKAMNPIMKLLSELSAKLT